MKTKFFKATFLVAAFAMTFASCSSDDSGKDPIIPGPDVIEGTVLTGDITSDLLMPKGNYTLRGAVRVKDGATLTIEAGSKITVTVADQAAGTNVLLVEQGAKLMAEGTQTEPIIFTSENQSAGASDGDWGGIVLHGRATINGTSTNPLSEAGQLPYSGNNDMDSSGSLKYVRVEYAGVASTDGNFEYNAFSFFACGSGTILENLEAYKGADDGFEFYGGTANASNLLAIGMEDDSIDWDQGYRGTLTNIAVYQLDNVGDFAFELSSRATEWNLLPRSTPTISNVTVRGHNKANKHAFELKDGTAGIFTNLKVYNFTIGAAVSHQLNQVQDGTLKFNNITLTVSGEKAVNKVAESTVTNQELATLLFSETANATGANLSVFSGWSNIAQVTF